MGIYCLTLFFNGAAQTDLEFKLRTQPLGDIELQIDAVLVDGSAAVVLPTSLDTQPARRSNGSPLALPFSTSTWSTISHTLLQVDIQIQATIPALPLLSLAVHARTEAPVHKYFCDDIAGVAG